MKQRWGEGGGSGDDCPGERGHSEQRIQMRSPAGGRRVYGKSALVGKKMTEEGERVILESQMEEEQARQNMTQLYITVLRDGRCERLTRQRHPPSTSATSPSSASCAGSVVPPEQNFCSKRAE